MWDLCWIKWHWDRFLPEYFVFPLSVSFHQCSITWKNEKKLIFFITGLHNKPQGCGASVASAAGPFTKKKKKGFLCISVLKHAYCLKVFIVLDFSSQKHYRKNKQCDSSDLRPTVKVMDNRQIAPTFLKGKERQEQRIQLSEP
jgi:hypothetical protein